MMMRNVSWKTKKYAVAAALLGCTAITQSAAAQEADEWQFGISLYGWYSDIDGSLEYPSGPGSGRDISIAASDIIDSLEFVLMGGVEARRGRWSVIFDGIYMEASDSGSAAATGPAGTPVNLATELDLTTWIVSGGVGYDVVRTSRGTMSVFGGVRYLDNEVDASVALAGVPAERSDTIELFDGIVGLRGSVNLNNHWYIPYHADIGAGDSELTWQLFAGIGYRFGWGDIRLGYRYLGYEQDDDKLLRDLELSGPILGVVFRF